MNVAIALLWSYINWDQACTKLGDVLKAPGSDDAVNVEAIRTAANDVLECGFEFHDHLCEVADPLDPKDEGWDFANEEIVDTRQALYRAWDFAHLGEATPPKIQHDPRVSWDEDWDDDEDEDGATTGAEVTSR